MSLRHGLLGLLAEGPASGFDLARRFQELLSAVWPAQHPKIYEELRRLERDGLIELESTGPRGRRSYELTNAGRDEVHRWLVETEVDHTLRLQAILRSVFFWQMSVAELRDHLRTEATYYREQADMYRAIAAAKDRGDYVDSPASRSIRVAAEAGIRLNEALAEWAEWAVTVPPAADSRSA